MNIYRVYSEILYEWVWMDYYSNQGYDEPYCIAELVAAKSRSQAKYLAWKEDKSYEPGDITEMPRMSVNICKKDIVMSPGIVSKDNRFQDCWGCAEGVDL